MTVSVVQVNQDPQTIVIEIPQGLPGEQAYDDYTGTPRTADIVTKGPWVDVRALGVDITGVVDCSTIVNGFIETTANLSVTYIEDGLRLEFPKGIFRADSPIKLGHNPAGKGFRIKVIGAGADQTIFDAPDGNDVFEIDITPPANVSQRGITIRDCSVMGNGTSTTQIGIYIYNQNPAAGSPELRGGMIENVNIYNCAYGIKIGQKIGLLTLNNIIIDGCNQYGFYNESTDSIFTNIKITGCKNGLYSTGGNNIWANFKVYRNGVCSFEEDYTTTYGAKFSCPRNIFTNMDFQENYYDGAVFYNCNNIVLNGINADGNGYGKIALSESYGGNGVILDGCHDVVGNVTADDSRTSNATQYYGLEVKDNCYDITLNYTEQYQVNAFPGTDAVNTVINLPEDAYLNQQLAGDLTIDNLIASSDFDNASYYAYNAAFTHTVTDGIMEVNTSGVNFPHIWYSDSYPATLTLTAGHVYAYVATVNAPSGYVYKLQVWNNTDSAVLAGASANVTGNAAYQTTAVLFTAPSDGDVYYLDIVDYGQAAGSRQTFHVKPHVLLDITAMNLAGAFTASQSVLSRYISRLIEASYFNYAIGTWNVGTRAILQALP